MASYVQDARAEAEAAAEALLASGHFDVAELAGMILRGADIALAAPPDASTYAEVAERNGRDAFRHASNTIRRAAPAEKILEALDQARESVEERALSFRLQRVSFEATVWIQTAARLRDLKKIVDRRGPALRRRTLELVKE